MSPSSTILIVHDNAHNRQRLREAFEQFTSDVEFLEASDCKETLAFLDREMSLILVDLNMPGMNDLDMIAQIRTRHTQTPMVVISTSLSSDMVERALHAGASCCYIKPENYSELCSLAYQMLRRFLQLV